MEQEPSTPPPDSKPDADTAVPQEEATDAVAVSKDARTMALLSHLLGVFTSFLVPLIIYIIKKDEDKFIEDQSKEALNFQITIMIGWFAAFALSFIVIGVILMPVLVIGNFVFGILAALKSNEGIAYRYPCTIRLVK